jgi:hypothetical protein
MTEWSASSCGAVTTAPMARQPLRSMVPIADSSMLSVLGSWVQRTGKRLRMLLPVSSLSHRRNQRYSLVLAWSLPPMKSWTRMLGQRGLLWRGCLVVTCEYAVLQAGHG